MHQVLDVSVVRLPNVVRCRSRVQRQLLCLETTNFWLPIHLAYDFESIIDQKLDSAHEDAIMIANCCHKLESGGISLCFKGSILAVNAGDSNKE